MHAYVSMHGKVYNRMILPLKAKKDMKIWKSNLKKANINKPEWLFHFNLIFHIFENKITPSVNILSFLRTVDGKVCIDFTSDFVNAKGSYHDFFFTKNLENIF